MSEYDGLKYMDMGAYEEQVKPLQELLEEEQMELEEAINNLEEYIRLDKEYIDYDDNDFSKFCKNHCADIQRLIDYIKKEKKEKEEIYADYQDLGKEYHKLKEELKDIDYWKNSYDNTFTELNKEKEKNKKLEHQIADVRKTIHKLLEEE